MTGLLLGPFVRRLARIRPENTAAHGCGGQSAPPVTS
jgi:hypothetical protein